MPTHSDASTRKHAAYASESTRTRPHEKQGEAMMHMPLLFSHKIPASSLQPSAKGSSGDRIEPAEVVDNSSRFATNK
jgi:hypothetical protein